MTDLSLVIFDVDGTLIDSRASIIRLMRGAFQSVGCAPPSDDRIVRSVGITLEPAIAGFLPDQPSPVHREIADAYRRLYDREKAAGHLDPLFDGSREVLAELNDRGHSLGVATGKSLRGVRAALEAHALHDLFVTFQTPDHNPSKPHPGMIERALAETGVDVQRALLVGDTSYDIEMAKNAGIASVGVPWGNHSPEELAEAGAEMVLTAFAELPAVVDQMISGSA